MSDIKPNSGSYREEEFMNDLERTLSTVVDHTIRLDETPGYYVFYLREYHELNTYPKLKTYGTTNVFDRDQGVTLFYIPKRRWTSTILSNWIDFFQTVTMFFMFAAWFVYLAYAIYPFLQKLLM